MLDEKNGFSALKLNLGHYGGGIVDKNELWMNKITDLILAYENVYTDFACQCFEKKDYSPLLKYIKKYSKSKLEDRILFGSDFMINLFYIDSYENYLKHFFKFGYKRKFCNENPYRFLFG